MNVKDALTGEPVKNNIYIVYEGQQQCKPINDDVLIVGSTSDSSLSLMPLETASVQVKADGYKVNCFQIINGQAPDNLLLIPEK